MTSLRLFGLETIYYYYINFIVFTEVYKRENWQCEDASLKKSFNSFRVIRFVSDIHYFSVSPNNFGVL